MHEMSLVRGLIRQIEQLARQNGAENVAVVRVKLGPLAHVEPDHFTEHFMQAAQGTSVEGARLEIETTGELHELTLETIELELREDAPAKSPLSEGEQP
ncbi:MAG: hydrogenase maturation nickel metallochaperone HypA [Planctomycetes bacterium]|nr:hydrogenase maturation nickel metallochaperone HypA [Planctomycetota bacterium]